MKQHWLDKMDGLVMEGDILDSLALLEDESVEAVVTDPPYELKFMGAAWDDQGVSFRPATWEACLRVLKPGGHMIMFGGTRTHHRMWCAAEDAGFEVREMLLWLYGQGLPKSYNVGQAVEKLLTTGAARRPDRDLGVGRRYSLTGDRPELMDTGGPVELTTEEAQEWAGWGTGLKPSVEPILLARKPLAEKNVAANVLKFGTGALHIDATRLEYLSDADRASATPQGRVTSKETSAVGAEPDAGRGLKRVEFERPELKGRWPANVMLQCTCDDPRPVPQKARKRRGEQSQDRRYDKKGATNLAAKPGTRREGGGFIHEPGCLAGMLDAQSGLSQSSGKINRWTEGAQPFGGAAGKPYESVPGHEDFGGASRFFYCPKAAKSEKGADNTHPTVKPIALMRWLVRMVTPPEGVVLDPFCGSGSTLIAAADEGFGFIGVDISPEYCGIALRRLKGRKS